jgi:hypothetical protein
MDLVMQRQPDAEGNLFQSSSEGSAVFASAAGETKPISLAVSVGVFNVNTATCNNYCIYCSGWTDFYLLPDSFTLTPGGTVQLTAYGTFMDDRNNTNRTYTLTPLLWNSSGSAASVSQSGLVTGQNAGTASVTAQENLTPESGVSPDCSFQCSPDYIRTSAPSSGTVQPTISGPTDVWYFGGQNPSQYATSITLQTQGSATWNVTQGASEINITPSGSQATITATGNSVSNNVGDAQITATVNNVTSQPFKLSTRRPFYSSSLGTTPACDSTYGYLDVINYNVDDNLSTAMPYSIGVNETFPPFSCNTLNGAVIDQPCNDYNGTNWKWGPIGGFQTAPSTPAQFGDSIGGQQLSLSPNPIPVCTGDSTAVQHWYQEWRMGSTQVGAGSRFQTDYIHKFVNHAEHQNIQTGSGVQP